MSMSAKHKAYRRNGGKLGFAEWVALYERLEVARSARAEARTPARKARVQKAQARVERATPKIVVTEPNELATSRQLWTLNKLGLLGQVRGQLTKGQASKMLDKALA